MLLPLGTLHAGRQREQSLNDLGEELAEVTLVRFFGRQQLCEGVPAGVHHLLDINNVLPAVHARRCFYKVDGHDQEGLLNLRRDGLPLKLQELDSRLELKVADVQWVIRGAGGFDLG